MSSHVQSAGKVAGAGVLLCALAAFSLWMRHAPPIPHVAANMVGKEANPAPAVEPVAYQDLTPEQAIAFNAMPAVFDPGPAARPFVIAPGVALDRAVQCLTTAIYYEAATEPVAGQRAVAQVVLNRVRHPAFPKSVCGVIYQGSERTTGCQFTFTCDGALARVPVPVLWDRARTVAIAALKGSVEPSVGVATHYHANWVVPYWASTLTRSATIGAHIFYRWNGFWGTPAAFRGRYAMVEPEIAPYGTTQLASMTAPLPNAEMPDSGGDLDAHSVDDGRTLLKEPPKTLKADLEAGQLLLTLNERRPLLADLKSTGRLIADGAVGR